MSVVLSLVFADLVGEILESGNYVFGFKVAELYFPYILMGSSMNFIQKSLLSIVDLGSYFFHISIEFKQLTFVVINCQCELGETR